MTQSVAGVRVIRQTQIYRRIQVLALIERGKYDIAAGWHEAAWDALWQARKLLQTHTEGNQ